MSTCNTCDHPPDCPYDDDVEACEADKNDAAEVRGEARRDG